MKYDKEFLLDIASDLEFDPFTATINDGGNITKKKFKDPIVWVFYEEDRLDIEDKRSPIKLSVKISDIDTITTGHNTIEFHMGDMHILFL